jgi:heat shock protein HtpX
MGDSPQPVLVYNRIDVNRRKTQLLMAAFVALLLPLAGGVAQYVTPASVFTRTIRPDELQPTESEFVAELIAAVMVLLAITSAAVCFAAQFSSSFLLRHVGARRASREKHAALCRTVENLCIGAGLPQPALYVVESDVANAFATGRDPQHASLVITSGLLSLLTPRELAAVVAHELSHIGNYDTRLGTMLAAVVATLRLPWSAGVSLLRLGSRVPLGRLVRAVPLLRIPLTFALSSVTSMISGIVAVGALLFYADVPAGLRLWRGLGVVMPLYVLFGAPFLATRLRRTISREREFLADADAVLLTRDPDGLALALVKVSRAGWGVKAGAATAHLYFVDPLPAAASWWDTLYQLHPPIEERIGHVATMGDGIPAEELEAAEQIGREYGERLYIKEARRRLPVALRPIEPAAGHAEDHAAPIGAQLVDSSAAQGTKFRLAKAVTPLYEKPDGWSKRVARLPRGAIVTVSRPEGNFVRVATNSASGYIPCGALAEPLQGNANQASHETGFANEESGFANPQSRTLNPDIVHEKPDARSQDSERFSQGGDAPITPLYEQPDGLSRVLAQLPHDAVLTSAMKEGNFIRVTTGNNTVGYVARWAPLAALKAFQQ